MEKSFTWITNIIDSWNNEFHFNCADVLISLFKMKYDNEEYNLHLHDLRNNKWNAIQGILM